MPDELIPQPHLVGDIFTHALARKRAAVNDAMDWVLERQTRIECKLA